MDEISSALVEQNIPYTGRIFCNRNLRLDRIRYIGFDMDYTLALYHEQMEHLQAEMVMARLVERGYPRELRSLRYDPGFAIRGLVVDVAHGNIFKMDSHRFVGKVWHGPGPLDRESRARWYTNRRIAAADPDFKMVDTLFSLPEISLYCQLVAHFDALPAGTPRPTYEGLWRDLRSAMDSLHRDDSLKARITVDLPRYVVKDPQLAETLHRFRSAGKSLFLMTNSGPRYSDAVMTYLLDGAHPAYARWEDYFDYIFTSARKPVFFVSDDPFFEIGPDGAASTEPARKLGRRAGKYVGGNLQDLQRMTGMIGDEVLYIGDHIYGDILRSKRYANWRTAMIIQELERELEHLVDHDEALDRLERLERQRFQLNLERAARALDGERDQAQLDRVRRLGRDIADLEEETSLAFNPHWGMLFRDRAELSAFGAQVEDYACIYTSRVSNFRRYSPVWYFRSPRIYMAHERMR